MLLHDQRAILSICCRIEGVAEYADITFALPHLVGGGGAAPIPLALAEREQAALRHSADILREAIGSLQLP